MAAEQIGRCKCPVCSSTKARLSLAKSSLTVVTCNGCNFQGFARSERSDDLLRALIVHDAPAPAPIEPDPQNAPQGAIAPSAPASKPFTWGVLR